MTENNKNTPVQKSYHNYILEETRRDRIVNEVMIMAAEESGELVQRCMKVLRRGITEKSKNDLLEEVGDVQCMIDLMIENDILTKEEIYARVEVKRDKLRQWSSLIND